MARRILSLVLTAASLSAALACAVPRGGCRPKICQSYVGMIPSLVEFPTANYSAASTWRDKGRLKEIGFYKGIYNKLYNGGWYNKLGLKDTPGLSYEKFDYPAAPYATASPNIPNIAQCCTLCAETSGCVAFQFSFYPMTVLNGDPSVRASYCFLLNGGTDKTDLAAGLPYSGPHDEQDKSPRKDLRFTFVGGRCNPDVNDDPHFMGAHGTRFDFNGELEKSFCLTADRDLQVNALLRGYEDTRSTEGASTKDGKTIRSWIREVAVLWKDAAGAAHTLHLVARDGTQQERGAGFVASASLDGAPIQVPRRADSPLKQGEMELAFDGVEAKGPYEIEKLSLRIGEKLDLTLKLRVAHPMLQTEDNAQVHFNLGFRDLETSADIHGVLGQTYRTTSAQLTKALHYGILSRLLGEPIQADGDSGHGFLDGQPGDYTTSSVTASDCKFSVFSKQA